MDMDLDNLLALPTSDDEQSGGGIDEDFVILTRDELEAKKTEAFFNIHTTPIILTEKMPADKKEISEVVSFLSNTGLQITDILAFNGEAVRKLITNPRDTGKGINEKLFLLRKGQTYESVSDLVEKQVAFICLFHHLFFLAKLAKTPNYPMFTDSFSDKFNAIQKSVQEIKNAKVDEGDTSTVSGAASQTTSQGFRNISMIEGSQGPPVSSSIFDISFKDIAMFWAEVHSDISLTDMVAVFKMNPTELYKWFTSDVKAPAIEEKVDTTTPTESVSAKTTIVSGANLQPEAENLIDKVYTQSGHEEAPPEITPSANEAAAVLEYGPPPTGTTLSKNIRRATRAEKKAVKTAENAVVSTETLESRPAKLAAVEKIQQIVAESRSRNTAATLEHKAVNNSLSGDENKS
jgi:hypothetical protein